MEIHQLVPTLGYGDAIGNSVLTLQRWLRSWGHESEIFAEEAHPRVKDLCQAPERLRAGPRTVTIYHHGIWSEPIWDRFRRLSGIRAMVYHNVTPAHFFAPYGGPVYDLTKKGRDLLRDLRDVVHVPLADSGFNRDELVEAGFCNVRVLPVPVDFHAFDAEAPDERVVQEFGDGARNLLFVGRLVPNKRHEDVVRVFASYHRYIDPASRLILAGSTSGMEQYVAHVRTVASALGVLGHVVFTGQVSLSELVALYRAAHLFVCMSEHEGFCVPLLEAMHHDVPVIARAEGAVPETLGDAGVLVRERNFPVIAEAAHLLVTDEDLRESVLRRQRERLRHFATERAADRFRECVDEWAA
jgi:glycosyltransferase involved in cell wall biosynthesis